MTFWTIVGECALILAPFLILEVVVLVYLPLPHKEEIQDK